MLRAISLAFRLATFVLVFFCIKAAAQSQLPAETQQKIDKVATDALAKTGVPSASVAAVKDGKIVYLHAYGNARLDP
jgi:D-alanyl-D-alanine carboxypeptidase